MATEIVARKCESCGRTIQVPAELTEFSCVYCGAKQHSLDFTVTTLPADEADRAYVQEHLLDCIRDFPDYFKQFTRKKYEASYGVHRDAIRETYEAMDRYVCAQPARRDELLEAFVNNFLEQWEVLQSSKRNARRRRKEFSDKLTLAWFTIPAIRGLGLSIGEDFTELLRKRFNERYPGNSFEIGSYEEIRSGFRKQGLLGLFGK